MKKPPVQSKSTSTNGSKLLLNISPNDLPLSYAQSPGEKYPDILNPSSSDKPEPSVIGGDGPSGSDYHHKRLLGGQGSSPTHPNFRVPSSLRFGRNVPFYGDLQCPCVDVISNTTTSELRSPINAILPHPIIGDSIPTNASTNYTSTNSNGGSTLPQFLGHRFALPPLANERRDSRGLVCKPDSRIVGQLMEIPRTTLSNNLASSSQLPPNLNLVHPFKPLSTTTREIEETLEVMRETRTEISILKDIKIMVFN
ncbi:hypothetical protein FXO38_30462 [Capsicum annuum]|nr:hypothetical protein FXO37_32998 [Capsicum annuum]KAF3624020.1 hypothetical protein FXO38_30462 [Capsicum annuum]